VGVPVETGVQWSSYESGGVEYGDIEGRDGRTAEAILLVGRSECRFHFIGMQNALGELFAVHIYKTTR
jgi:hypothetical protein